MSTTKRTKQTKLTSIEKVNNWRERLRTNWQETEKGEVSDIMLHLDLDNRAGVEARRIAIEVRGYRIGRGHSHTSPDPVCEAYIEGFRKAFAEEVDRA